MKETGDARKGMLDKPFETGAILVFDVKGSVQISGNEVRGNDYGIMVQGHRFRAQSVSVHDNKVQDNHRAAFIWVGQADRVDIHDNFFQDNGLNVFYDNEGLVRAMQKGEDFGDGRTQGILTKDCHNVRIFKNTVINSVSDGIGIICSSNNTIRGNDIHHNGDGGIGWNDAGYVEKRPSANNVIEDNNIHDNRMAAFVVWGETLGRTILKNNEVTNNGGNPIHFEVYGDYDVRTHLEDWQFDGEPVVFKLTSDEQGAMFETDKPSLEQRGDDGKILLLFLFVAAGLLLAVLAVPMVFRKVPPNYWYGFRVRRPWRTKRSGIPQTSMLGSGCFGWALALWSVRWSCSCCRFLTSASMRQSLVVSSWLDWW